ncbi:L,D-transpeptidase family protein [Lichenihabitans sp. PAMC28606]|nr:L,D-transpeptidase family protein [Lichenihabitans sp. PAMC28606]
MLGPSGMTRQKREGDGGTPIGVFAMLGGFFRSDRASRLQTAQSMQALRVTDGWCDDTTSSRYNRAVQLPVAGRHERMWREDRLYDLGVVIDYNLNPTRKGRGSAIFMHVMSPGGTPTAGCVALRPDDLRRLLPRLAPGCRLEIG